MNRGDQVRTAWVVLRNQLTRYGVRLFVPTHRVVTPSHRETHGGGITYSLDFRQRVLRPPLQALILCLYLMTDVRAITSKRFRVKPAQL
jgi:hypothetical protein